MKSNASVDGLDDHIDSITRTVSDSSDSNMTDAEVEMDIPIHKTIHHFPGWEESQDVQPCNVLFLLPGQNINKQQIVKILTFHGNKATLSKTKHKELMDMRSTPDLKHFDSSEVSSLMIYI